MKKFYFAILVLFASSLVVQAQSSGKVPPKGCFEEWEVVFRERGGKLVPDGTHEIIIAIVKDQASHCFLGKTTVQAGRIVGPTFVQKEDGTFEPIGKKLDPAVFHSDRDVSLIEGASSQLLKTSDGETAKLYFYKFLNDKVKANKTAPSPADLIKN